MANLVEQIFQQAQSGTAQGQHLGDYYFEGKKLRQDQQRINLMERQLAQQAAMQEVERVTMMQQQAMNAFKLQDAMLARENERLGREAFSNLNRDISMALSEATPVDAFKMYTEAGSKNTRLFFSPEYLQMGKALADAAKLQNDQEIAAIRLESEKRLAQQAADRLALEKRDQELKTIDQDLRSRNLKRLESRFVSEPDKAKIESLQKQVDMLNKQRLELPNVQGNHATRFRLATEAAAIQKQIDAIGKTESKPAASEKVRVISPKGQSGYIPADQLEEALKSGYRVP